MTNKEYIIRLGVEELSMGLILCNEPGFGLTLLKNLEKPIPDQLIEASLDTARRSLKARGLLLYNDQSKENLLPELATALKTLASFDSVLSVTRVENHSNQTDTIHLRSMADFVSWTNENQVVFTISLNPANSPRAYLLQKFNDFGENGSLPIAGKQKISMDVMNKIIDSARLNADIGELLISSGWEVNNASDFKADIVNQVYRASIIWTKTGNRHKPENGAKQERTALFLVKGKSRCWVLEFAELSEKAAGEAYRVTDTEFKRVLMATLP